MPITHDAATDYYNAAVQLTANGDYAGAIALYDKALGSNTTMMNRTDALLYTFQGKSYAQIQLGNYTDVIVTIDTGLEKFPTDPMLWNNKGYAQYSLGKYADAVTSYDRALASDGNNTLALINKGDALVKLGNYQDAIMTYKAALENDPGNNATATKLADAEKAAASTLAGYTDRSRCGGDHCCGRCHVLCHQKDSRQQQKGHRYTGQKNRHEEK